MPPSFVGICVEIKSIFSIGCPISIFRECIKMLFSNPYNLCLLPGTVVKWTFTLLILALLCAPRQNCKNTRLRRQVHKHARAFHMPNEAQGGLRLCRRSVCGAAFCAFAWVQILP